MPSSRMWMGHRGGAAALFALAAFAILAAVAPVGASAEVPVSAPFWKKCDTGPAAGQCYIPTGIASSPVSGHIYVADLLNSRINELDAWGQYLQSWGWGVADGDAELQSCTAASGCVKGTAGSGPGQLDTPLGVAVDTAGDVYVVDGENHRVQKFSPAGEFLLTFGGGVLDHGGATGSASLSAGSATLTSVITTSKAFAVGQTILGTGIPPQARIEEIGAGTITLSVPVTASGTGVALTVPATPGTTPNNEVQRIPLEGATGGTFTLSFSTAAPDSSKATTAPISFNASAAEVSAALEALPSIAAGDIAVSGPGGGPYEVEFKGARFADTNVETISGLGSNLVGGPLAGISFGAKTTIDGASAPDVCIGADLTAGYACVAGGTGPGNGQFEEWPRGSAIAAGPGGSIHVGDRGRVQEFDGDGHYVSQAAGPVLSGKTVHSLAVDPNGNIYTAFAQKEAFGFYDGSKTEPDVRKLSPAGAELCALKVANPFAVAVDVAGNVYVVDYGGAGDPKSEVRQFDSACAEVGTPFGEEEIGLSLGIATGTACLMSGADVYVTNTSQQNSFVRAYGPPPDKVGLCPPPQVPPDVRDQYALSVDPDSAVLRATINPRFWADTRYHVQYGTATCLEAGWEAPCVKTQPAVPGALLGAGSVDADVTSGGVFVGGLQAGTEYRYRFVASSGGGGPVFGIGGSESEEGKDSGFTTPLLAGPPPPDSCPNAQYRTGAASRLPDCRAYEMVSPVDKNGGDIISKPNVPARRSAYVQASVTGEKITYSSYKAFGDQPSSRFSNQYVSSRGTAGWSTHGINAPQGTTIFDPEFDVGFELDTQVLGFTPDLSSVWVRDFNLQPLAAGAQQGEANIYRRDNLSGVYEALTVGEPLSPSTESMGLTIRGYSTDLSHMVFTAEARLTLDAPANGNSKVYDYSDGELSLVSVLPNGTPSSVRANVGTEPLVQPYEDTELSLEHAVSEDGSRIYWSSSGRLYVRVDAQTTIAVSKANAKATYWGATPDGSKALYSEGEKLFVFDLEAETSEQIATKVTGVAGVSEDLSRIYLASTQDLAGDAEAGQPNLYLYEAETESEGGPFAFVATLAEADVAGVVKIPGGVQVIISDVTSNPIFRSTKVSPDGGAIAFMSTERLTDYDNTDANSGKADSEVFHYDAASKELICVSCDPTGARPAGRPLQSPYTALRDDPTPIWGAAWLPTAEKSNYANRPLSGDGKRLFFNSFVPLVQSDTNGAQDVYQWEAEGKGSCATEGGCVSLISSGESPDRSEFMDASPDGGDVFFTTNSSLDPQDPGLIDVYVARIGGGYPQAVEPPECLGDACQSIPTTPNDPTPASVGFKGAGNPGSGQKPRPRCAKNQRAVKRKGKSRCVAKKSKRRQKLDTRNNGKAAR
ncbi:MAG: hypothetical protein ABW196_06900 [Solirubrobacterales bacterium]